MKVISKNQLVTKARLEKMVMRERDILSKLSHPFMVNLHYAFQTTQHLIFVMDYVGGGELFYHLHERERPPVLTDSGFVSSGFPEAQARLYVAELASALLYVHSLNVVYRDLKPENVLLREDGHIALCDFGLSVQDPNSTQSLAGTVEYLPPEVLTGLTMLSFGVDWWALGVLMWELLECEVPFSLPSGELAEPTNPGDVEQIVRKQLDGVPFPQHFSPEAQLFLRSLLQPVPELRIGHHERKSAQLLKESPWLTAIDWTALEAGEYPPVFAPGDVSAAEVADDPFSSGEDELRLSSSASYSSDLGDLGLHGFSFTAPNAKTFSALAHADSCGSLEHLPAELSRTPQASFSGSLILAAT